MTTQAEIVNRGVFDRCPYASIERTLAADPKAWIETYRLMAAIESGFARKPMPETVRAYLRKRLDGEARKRQGRGRRTASRKLRDASIWANFSNVEDWLNARKGRHGLRGWRFIRDADFWQGPPSERAARIVKRRLDLDIDWESIRNIAYRIRRHGLPIM